MHRSKLDEENTLSHPEVRRREEQKHLPPIDPHRA